MVFVSRVSFSRLVACSDEAPLCTCDRSFAILSVAQNESLVSDCPSPSPHTVRHLTQVYMPLRNQLLKFWLQRNLKGLSSLGLLSESLSQPARCVLFFVSTFLIRHPLEIGMCSACVCVLVPQVCLGVCIRVMSIANVSLCILN